ncbi:uncharacterized protein MYCGRDRAFT_111397 [Zymoseptoria tritici IPO323]|uniref:Uncharacterized protein n=1 Tax=Zymoseptoria tritici (strain CBS 115943 / IPO323) TaxID=336722 RepID=F9XPH4_ZYMTI|nr:uncharacterized protein MYCGRDRAFT_111397 [Zymoseptoria tritici IPO323]EGP83201.1 hypothetical protein MYCGRDRAFT_111397 [Zymoseptoria tritici IPO323]
MIQPTKRTAWLCGTLLAALVLLGFTFHDPIRGQPIKASTELGNVDATRPASKLHLLLPASNGAVDLCKTFLTGAILGYPTPTLIAWNQTFNDDRLLGGGSHVAKVYGVLKFFEGMNSSTENDLVMMMDAYDIWFQLRPEVLISRYHSVNQRANERLKQRLGNAYDKENIRQRIIFGAGKRCAPNQMHTIACYPIPASPLPDDLYGGNTDTVMGKNKISSLKQRYLNSGYIIGPQKDMLALFRRAAEKVDAHTDHDPWDNGSGGSDLMYHGSDQSIFNIMYGEQEYQREVLRRRHLSAAERLRGKAKPIPHYLEGTLVADPLKPDFIHEPGVERNGAPDEFGIGLDLWSDLGQQTVNTEDDTRYLTFDKNISEQLAGRNGLFDCQSRVTGDLPQDVISSTAPLSSIEERASVGWKDTPLFTNLCLNTIPVMIHHNGDKNARAFQWPETWMQQHARVLMTELWSQDGDNEEGDGKSWKVANLPSGGSVTWGETCPSWFDYELFRDVEKPEKEPPPA